MSERDTSGEGKAHAERVDPPPYTTAQPQYGGPPWRGMDDPRRKSPALACILSVIPGLGQVYVGYYQRGFVHAIVVATLISLLAGQDGHSELVPLGAIFLVFFWFYNLIDAGRRAALYNHALAGGETIELPSDLTLPSRMRGSIAGGLVLIGLGVILLSHTAYGYSLEWLEDWWPAGLLILGTYLLTKGVLERQKPA